MAINRIIFMKKSLVILALVILCRSLAFADVSDVRAFYVETDRADAVSRYDHLEFYGRYFVKTTLEKGLYEIEVGDKLDSKFYAIRDTKYFMYFRYSESLYKYDEGILKVTNSLDAAEYYKKNDACDIKEFYVEVSRSDAERAYDCLELDGRYFVKDDLEKGIFEVVVVDKVSSDFYEIKNEEYRFNDVRLFARFRYSPFLYRYDKGFVKVTDSFDAGRFFKK